MAVGRPSVSNETNSVPMDTVGKNRFPGVVGTLIIYARAEAAMEPVLQRAEDAQEWTLDANDIPLFEVVLRQ